MKLIEQVQGLMQFGERGWVESIRLICVALDQREVELERVRVHLGFGSDWSPAYDRTQRTAPNSPIKWVDKFQTLNGMGMVAPFLQELAAGHDILEEKMAEAVAMMDVPKPTAEERRPGRPTNAEIAARNAAA